MSVKKSQFLGAFGKAFQIFKAITDAVLDIGGTDADVTRILTDSELCKDLANRIVNSRNQPRPSTANLDRAIAHIEEVREASERPQREYLAQKEATIAIATEKLYAYVISEEGRKPLSF